LAVSNHWLSSALTWPPFFNVLDALFLVPGGMVRTTGHHCQLKRQLANFLVPAQYPPQITRKLAT
jgi:hypothetical protein